MSKLPSVTCQVLSVTSVKIKNYVNLNMTYPMLYPNLEAATGNVQAPMALLYRGSTKRFKPEDTGLECTEMRVVECRHKRSL